jgi:hypothetical protein
VHFALPQGKQYTKKPVLDPSAATHRCRRRDSGKGAGRLLRVAATRRRMPDPVVLAIKRSHCTYVDRERRLRAGILEGHGLDPADCGTHSIRRSKTTLISRVRRTCEPSNCCLGIASLESTVRCLGIDVDDALEIAGQTEI